MYVFDESETPNKRISWKHFYKAHYKPELCLLTINARSIKNKFSEFVAHLSVLKVKITFIFITETWLSETSDVLFELAGYKSLNFYRGVGRGGCMKFYYLEHISTNILNQSENSCEMLLVSTCVPRLGNLKICCVYGHRKIQ